MLREHSAHNTAAGGAALDPDTSGDAMRIALASCRGCCLVCPISDCKGHGTRAPPPPLPRPGVGL